MNNRNVIFKQTKKSPVSFFIIAITIIIVCVPLILKIPCFSTTLSWFLNSLPSADYKIAYIGLIGSIIGTYLAITGAIWVQKWEQRETQKEEIKKTATIIYYDLKLGCIDLLSILNCNRQTIDGNVYIDSDWISRVANLSTDKIDIQKIYSIYGNFCNVNLKLSELRGNGKFVSDCFSNTAVNKILVTEFRLSEDYDALISEDRSYNEENLIESCVVSDIKDILKELKLIAGIK